MRLGVSELDAWRYYRASEEASLDDLLARLRRETPPTEPMMAGSALHKALEHANGEADVLEADGYRFHFQADCELYMPAIRELKGELEMDTPAGPITLVGVVDAIAGEVQDHKLSARFDAERYSDSYQWRCYLRMFNAKRFVYNVFVGKPERPKVYTIYEFHKLPLYAYPEMHQDVQREVEQFAQFVWTYLPERRLDLLSKIAANSIGTQA
jgi:hypothetical protein